VRIVSEKPRNPRGLRHPSRDRGCKGGHSIGRPRDRLSEGCDQFSDGIVFRVYFALTRGGASDGRRRQIMRPDGRASLAKGACFQPKNFCPKSMLWNYGVGIVSRVDVGFGPRDPVHTLTRKKLGTNI
jgi:hypothetical protein